MHETELFALERFQFERRRCRRSGIYTHTHHMYCVYNIHIYGSPDDGGVLEWRGVDVGVWVYVFDGWGEGAVGKKRM